MHFILFCVSHFKKLTSHWFHLDSIHNYLIPILNCRTDIQINNDNEHNGPDFTLPITQLNCISLTSCKQESNFYWCHLRTLKWHVNGKVDQKILQILYRNIWMCMYGFQNQLMVFKHFLVGYLLYNGIDSGLLDSQMLYRWNQIRKMWNRHLPIPVLKVKIR